MFITTQGIVLRTHPFKDNQLIIKLFTKDDGPISCIIKKNRSQIILSEILTLAEITYKKTKNTSIFYIKECQVEYVYKSIPRCQQKISCAMILCDILNKCLNEVSPFLYDFIADSFKNLDSQKKYPVNFKNLFLIKFCDIMGIAPLNNIGDNSMLSLKEGRYILASSVLNKRDVIPLCESREISRLSSINYDELDVNSLEKNLSSSVFNFLITYISIHLTDLTKLKSIKVLKEMG
mgnify:FL=1